MADVLTQAQIDEMLKNVAAGAVPVVSQQETQKIKEYDFRAPKKFTKEQIKVLDGIFESYARLLSSYLTGLLRLYCRVSLVNIEEQRYSEFNNALPDYVLMGMVDMGIKNEEVSETTVIVQISNTITFTMIDRLLGGRGEFRDVNRDFTEIEITIMTDVMSSMAGLLYEPWAAHIELEPKLIGISQYGEHPSLDNCRTGFLQGLEEAGLKEGVDFTVDYQNANFDDATATQIAGSFSSNGVDMMVGIATPAAVACYAAAEEKDIPVIFTAITDPVGAKLDSGNITGTSDVLPVAAQLELIRALQPEARSIGIVYSTSEANSLYSLGVYEELAASYDFTIESVGVTAQSEVTQAADALLARVGEEALAP